MDSKSKTRMNFYGIPYCEVKSDTHELEDFYSLNDFVKLNLGSFTLQMTLFNEKSSDFNNFDSQKKTEVLRKLLNQLEMTDESKRMNAARSILYIAQGCPSTLYDITDVKVTKCKENVLLLLKLGVFNMLLQQLNIEINSKKYTHNSFTDDDEIYNIDVILNIIYLMLEQARIQKFSPNIDCSNELYEYFIKELNCEEKDSLFFILLDMSVAFSIKKKPKYPIKKILLAMWKLIYVYFGNLKYLSREKCRIRLSAGLNIEHCEDTAEPLLQKVSSRNFNCFMHKFNSKCSRSNSTLIYNESVKSLKKYLYVSLSELQVKNKIPTNEKIDTLYGNLLPKMSAFIYSLMEIFDHNNALLNRKTSNDSLNILRCISSCGKVSHTKTTLRHFEAINKAVTGIILLLLKHFKLNHIYQFEYLSEILVNCGAIENFTSFIEMNSKQFIKLSKSFKKEIPANFTLSFSSTSLFACINTLRIIIKLIKWKDERIFLFMDRISQSLFCHNFLSNEVLSVYCLKLLKMVSKMVGKKWRQENVAIMNEIYKKVRRHLIEDLSCWDNKGDFAMLSEQLRCYNKRFAQNFVNDEDFDKFISNLPSTEIPNNFNQYWDKWVDVEVIQNPFDWDLLLNGNFCT